MARTTRRELVLRALQRAQASAEKGSGDGWVCGRSLMHPTVGGNRFGARLHELRERGHGIERKVCRCTQCRHFNGKARERGEQPPNIHAWRLAIFDRSDLRRTA